MKLAVVVSMFFALLSVSVVHADDASLLNGRWKLQNVTCSSGAQIADKHRQNLEKGFYITLQDGSYVSANVLANGCRVLSVSNYSIQKDTLSFRNRLMTLTEGCGSRQGLSKNANDTENKFTFTGSNLIIQSNSNNACPAGDIEYDNYVKQ